MSIVKTLSLNSSQWVLSKIKAKKREAGLKLDNIDEEGDSDDFEEESSDSD